MASSTESTRESQRQDRLMSPEMLILVCGVVSLGAYWAWIFSIFSATVVNPFHGADISLYLPLPVLAAFSSAVSSLCIALGYKSQVLKDFFSSTLGNLILAVASSLCALPALLSIGGVQVGLAHCIAPWFIATAASSLVYIKTGAFLIWLRRSKLPRCIALGFLLAALLYLLAICLQPLAGIIVVICMPVISCVCSAICTELTQTHGDPPLPKRAPASDMETSFKGFMKELTPFMPTTFIYAIPFGIVSCVVLSLAAQHNLVYIIAISIMASALFTFFVTFVLKSNLEAESFQRKLLPLIAIALLPFPYLNVFLKIVFLSVVVFAFTCWDAVGWGDLADEARSRNLKADSIGYQGAATFINFTSVFIGWGLGFLLCHFAGAEHLDHYFGIVSIVIVILLIIGLTVSETTDGEATTQPVVDSAGSQKIWEQAMAETAAHYRLSKQEARIFAMLARGRNYKYIENELVISGHTVKTHVYHIYSKMGIHSQQELIDLVEKTVQEYPQFKEPGTRLQSAGQDTAKGWGRRQKVAPLPKAN